MYDAGHPESVLCDSLKGWVGREVEAGFGREGTRVFLWPIHVDV